MKTEKKEQKFFQWKKVLVRSVHLFLTLFITGSLIIKNTELHKSLLLKHYAYVSAYIFLVYSSILFYFLTCLTDSHYVKPSSEDCESNKKISTNSTVKLRYCDICNLEQPIRARHCDECQRCIKKFDHHCPWLECCIGENNHKFFWLFLATTLATIIWSFVVAWRAFMPALDWAQWISYNIIYIVDLHALFISFLVCFGLFLIHTNLMLTNTTTWEKFSRRNITYLRSIKDESINPFHESYLRNILQFCCYCNNVEWENIYGSKVGNNDVKMEQLKNSNHVEISSSE